jgi:hypothetical protein
MAPTATLSGSHSSVPRSTIAIRTHAQTTEHYLKPCDATCNRIVVVYQVNSSLTWQLRDVRRKFGSETWARDTRQQHHVATTAITFIFSQRAIPASLPSSLFEIADHRNVIVINHRQRHGKWEFNGQGPSTITLQRFSSLKGERCPSCQGGRKRSDVLIFCAFAIFSRRGKRTEDLRCMHTCTCPGLLCDPLHGVQVP